MTRQLFGGLMLAGILAIPAAAQMPDFYLDVFVAKVKGGKRGDFDAVNKRMVDFNRKNKGDTWLAYEVTYGEPNTVYFVSRRSKYGDIETGVGAFLGAIGAGVGKANVQRFFDGFDAATESQHAEIRRRRWDLSSFVPTDNAAYTKLVGESRYMRVVTIRTRPGKSLDFEKQIRMNKTALESANPNVPVSVSQAVVGQATGVYYISNMVKSMADLDNIKTLQEALGSRYESYMKVVSESVISTQIMIVRFLPELSNPPEEIVAVDPKYWRPAPTPVTAAPKPTTEKKGGS